jgi:hypothetical protein
MVFECIRRQTGLPGSTVHQRRERCASPGIPSVVLCTDFSLLLQWLAIFIIASLYSVRSSYNPLLSLVAYLCSPTGVDLWSITR